MKIPDLLWKPEFWVEYEPGRTIFVEGEPGDALFVLMEGVIKGQVVGAFQPVEILGEMALIDHQPRSATLRAKMKCKLARVDENRFQNLIQHRPEFALEIMRSLAERLRWKESAMTNVVQSDARLSDSLKTELRALKSSLETLTKQLGQVLQKLAAE